MIPQQDDEDGAGRATIAARTATASAIIATMVGLAVGLGKFVRVLHGQLVGCLQLNALNMCLQQLALCRVASTKRAHWQLSSGSSHQAPPVPLQKGEHDDEPGHLQDRSTGSEVIMQDAPVVVEVGPAATAAAARGIRGVFNLSIRIIF